MKPLIYIRGGGDLATGVALRCYRAGLKIIITEVEMPLAVRRAVSFAQAVYSGKTEVEGVIACRIKQPEDAFAVWKRGEIPLLVDPAAVSLAQVRPQVLVDARMTKKPPELPHPAADLVIGLGPGFTAGENCHAVVETKRGHTMGRIYWRGQAEENTGVPEAVEKRQNERVLRAPNAGMLRGLKEIGDVVEVGEPLAEVDGKQVLAPFTGLLRGLVSSGVQVESGMKIGDIDPRTDAYLVRLVSDKALAMGGAVLEAIFGYKQWSSQE